MKNIVWSFSFPINLKSLLPRNLQTIWNMVQHGCSGGGGGGGVKKKMHCTKVISENLAPGHGRHREIHWELKPGVRCIRSGCTGWRRTVLMHTFHFLKSSLLNMYNIRPFYLSIPTHAPRMPSSAPYLFLMTIYSVVCIICIYII